MSVVHDGVRMHDVDMPLTAHRLVASDIRRIAVAADVDPRSVCRVLEGRTTQPSTRRRIVAALIELGLGDMIPSNVLAQMGPWS